MHFLSHLHSKASNYDIASATVHGYRSGYLVAAGFALAAAVIATVVIRAQKGKTDSSHGEPVVLA
jgi:hypothetical protein